VKPFRNRLGHAVRSVRRIRRIRLPFSPAWKAIPRVLARLELTRFQPAQPPFFTALHQSLDRHPVTTLGQLLDEAGEQIWGLAVFLLAMLTFIPGVANPLSLVTLVLGIRMMMGVSRPWIPEKLRRIALHRGKIKDLLAKVEARIAWLSARRGPRKAPSQGFLGCLVAWTAFVAALPIPLPFANVLPAIALILFGVALLEEWPFMAWVGALISLGTTVYFAFSIQQIIIMFTEMGHWLLDKFHPGWLPCASMH
jgi:hypothetical protein